MFFELQCTNTWEAQTQTDAIRKVYHRAVAIPLLDVEQIWREYDGFENKLNKMTVSGSCCGRVGRCSRVKMIALYPYLLATYGPAACIRWAPCVIVIGTLLVCVICPMNCNWHDSCEHAHRPSQKRKQNLLSIDRFAKPPSLKTLFLVFHTHNPSRGPTCTLRPYRPRNSLPSVPRST